MENSAAALVMSGSYQSILTSDSSPSIISHILKTMLFPLRKGLLLFFLEGGYTF
jgi:hypothetical protein